MNVVTFDKNHMTIGIKSVLDNYQFQDNEIEIADYDGNLIGKRYNNGVFEEAEPIDTTEPKPTLEEIAEVTLLETQYQTTILELMNDKTI